MFEECDTQQKRSEKEKHKTNLGQESGIFLCHGLLVHFARVIVPLWAITVMVSKLTKHEIFASLSHSWIVDDFEEESRIAMVDVQLDVRSLPNVGVLHLGVVDVGKQTMVLLVLLNDVQSSLGGRLRLTHPHVSDLQAAVSVLGRKVVSNQTPTGVLLGFRFVHVQ